MKKIKKLSLNKEKIDQLNNEDMSVLKGGQAAATNASFPTITCTGGTIASIVSIIESVISIIKETLPSPEPQPPIDCCGTIIIQK
ncbi:TIGR04149 family rSAM-modified RiPP [Gynurincola endophyticus]|jgi:natural product precursor|uniref:TIGR04149 family rSAM-modified RiPP n=1 Tax=Gynurincola endophyticus TaxID=2479004 RepID=UPI000F8CA166|nr:TIGR04149 family rSAM-modified RiPP [Gynurincola endophyticus]